MNKELEKKRDELGVGYLYKLVKRMAERMLDTECGEDHLTTYRAGFNDCHELLKKKLDELQKWRDDHAKDIKRLRRGLAIVTKGLKNE